MSFRNNNSTSTNAPPKRQTITNRAHNNGSVLNVTARHLQFARAHLEQRLRHNRETLLHKKRLSTMIEDEISEREEFVERELDFYEREYADEQEEAMQREIDAIREMEEVGISNNNNDNYYYPCHEDDADDDEIKNYYGYTNEEYNMEDPAELYEYHLQAQQKQQQQQQQSSSTSSSPVNGLLSSSTGSSTAFANNNVATPNSHFQNKFQNNNGYYSNENDTNDCDHALFQARYLDQDSAVPMISKNGSGNAAVNNSSVSSRSFIANRTSPGADCSSSATKQQQQSSPSSSTAASPNAALVGSYYSSSSSYWNHVMINSNANSGSKDRNVSED